jgi:ABC-type phosphate transport system auxiliary subunit
MGPGEVFIALIVIGLPILALTAILTRWFKLKEKKFEMEASLAAEKAAQYAASNAELEARIRVLEKIVTDGGMETAAQIEALRDLPPTPGKARPAQAAIAENKQ